LQGHCWDYTVKNEWWTYRWCYKSNVEQLHFPRRGREPSVQNSISQYINVEPHDSAEQYFIATTAECEMDDGDFFQRRANVSVSCCSKKQNSRRQVRADVSIGTHIRSVEEYLSCHYKILVCSDLLCDPNNLPVDEDEEDRNNWKRESILPPKHTNSPKLPGDKAVPPPRQAQIKNPKQTQQTHTQGQTVSMPSPNTADDELFRGATVTVEQQAELKERVRAM
jgi:hypothetical protein